MIYVEFLVTIYSDLLVRAACAEMYCFSLGNEGLDR